MRVVAAFLLSALSAVALWVAFPEGPSVGGRLLSLFLGGVVVCAAILVMEVYRSLTRSVTRRGLNSNQKGEGRERVE
jgi:hypothetical protein